MLLHYATRRGGLMVRNVGCAAEGCMFEPYANHFLIIEREVIERIIINENLISGFVAMKFVFHKVVKSALRGFRSL